MEEPVIELSEEPIINDESVVESNHEAPEQVLVEPENEIEEALQYQEDSNQSMKQKLRLKWKNQLLNCRKNQ